MADSTEILMLDEMRGLIGSGVHLCQPCADLTEADQKRFADGSHLAKTVEQFLDTLCPECRWNAAKLFTPDPWDEHTKHIKRVLDEKD